MIFEKSGDRYRRRNSNEYKLNGQMYRKERRRSPNASTNRVRLIGRVQSEMKFAKDVKIWDGSIFRERKMGC